MKIVILRHGQPDFSQTGLMSSAEFKEWVRSYDESSIVSSSKPSSQLNELAKSSSLVVCSSLRRSVDSGKLLKDSDKILIDSIFNEAGLPTNDWCFVKMTSNLWLIILRIMWFLGYSSNSESRKEASVRAKKAAQLLNELSKKNAVLMLVGHGIINRLLGRALTDIGWKVQKDAQSNYWSYAVYEFKKT